MVDILDISSIVQTEGHYSYLDKCRLIFENISRKIYAACFFNVIKSNFNQNRLTNPLLLKRIKYLRSLKRCNHLALMRFSIRYFSFYDKLKNSNYDLIILSMLIITC